MSADSIAKALTPPADEPEEVAEQLTDGFDILLRPFFQQAALERSMEIEHRPIRDGVVADEDLTLEDLLRDHVDRPSDETVDDEPLAVRRGNRAS